MGNFLNDELELFCWFFESTMCPIAPSFDLFHREVFYFSYKNDQNLRHSSDFVSMSRLVHRSVGFVSNVDIG